MTRGLWEPNDSSPPVDDAVGDDGGRVGDIGEIVESSSTGGHSSGWRRLNLHFSYHFPSSETFDVSILFSHTPKPVVEASAAVTVDDQGLSTWLPSNTETAGKIQASYLQERHRRHGLK